MVNLMPLKNCNEKHCCFHLQKLNIENIALKKCNENHCIKKMQWISLRFSAAQIEQWKSILRIPILSILVILLSTCPPALMSACASAHLPSCASDRLDACPHSCCGYNFSLLFGQMLCMKIPNNNNNNITLLRGESEARN